MSASICTHSGCKNRTSNIGGPCYQHEYGTASPRAGNTTLPSTPPSAAAVTPTSPERVSQYLAVSSALVGRALNPVESSKAIRWASNAGDDRVLTQVNDIMERIESQMDAMVQQGERDEDRRVAEYKSRRDGELRGR